MSLDLNELRELLAAIDQTDITELTLKSADFELTVHRGVRVEERLYASDSDHRQAVEASASRQIVGDSRTDSEAKQVAQSAATPSVPNAPSNDSPLRDSKSDRRLIEVNSPMVGTFYRAASPDEPPFVEVGDRIRKGQTVCIIEAMKLMNELEAEIGGEVVEILVQNGEPIEYGQLLLRLNPD
ncbi:acetyl-CoA carboxylase biotin carboxyl carrier protein [Leptolyngbya sp. FACHB-321]|uniref:acetyl-CoA carboxylase biotin carboxyl carrier protein n=1 Tax=Leptolyngbya sp. FACHB-321 TaxID=2692807 RepID=UPI00168A1A13|nr:acetyl-CoA carboxylase biotin carboxyl carrier protein [Leptolyngbya sp. FACHB-321]